SRSALKLLASAARPLAWVVDSAAVRMPLSLYPVPAASAEAAEAGVEHLLACIADLPPRWTLRPLYTPNSLGWLLEKAGEAKRRGYLRKLLVRNAKGEMLGWYIYYAKPGGIAKVLQIGGREHGISEVIDHLFHDAWRRGALAVSGRLEPRFARELSQKR